jgi:hypothetical protein
MAFRELINLIGFELDEAALRDVEQRTSMVFDKMKDWGEKWSLRVSTPIIAAGVLAVNKFAEYNEELAIVRQRIESTGGTAGKTADQLEEMSNALSKGTKFTHDQVLAAEDVLLRFGNVTKGTYDRAAKAAIDFAAANKMDVTSSAQFLGRALESPGEGMRRLAMMGIYFTKVERARMQAMVDSGHIAQAQALILDKVEKSTGGVAKKVAEASSGFFKLKKSIDEVQESFGQVLIPYFRKFYDAASKVLDWFNRLSPEIKQTIILFGAIAAAIPLVVGALGGLGLAVNSIISGLLALKGLNMLTMLGPWLLWAVAIAAIGVGIALLTEDIIAFSKGKKSLIGTLLGDIPAWWDGFVEDVKNFINMVAGIIGLKPFETKRDKYAADEAAISSLQEKIRLRNAKTPEEKGSAVFVGEDQPYIAFGEGKPSKGVSGSFDATPWSMKPSPATVASVSNRNASTNITVNQQLPPGTSDEHKKQVKQYTEDLFNEHLNKHLRNAYQNFSVVTP